MSGKKLFMALCAIAIGKSIIEPGKPLPTDVSAGKISSLLANGSIEPAIAEAEPATPPASGTETVLPTVTGDGSGQALPEVSDTMKDAEGVVFDGGELAGVVTTDGAIKPLEDLTVAELKKMAADAGVKGAANMNKAALVAALSAA